jgi:CheY-specific phosphatase CheX
MTSESSIEVHPSEVAEIVESVFLAMLGLGAQRDGPPWFADPNRLTAAVHMAGNWNGALLVECSREQAAEFARRFLRMDSPDNDVVRDVLGELANMIGGNLKCVLSRGITLSMPSVVDGSDYCFCVCGAELRERLAFQCQEGPFWVSILAARATV